MHKYLPLFVLICLSGNPIITHMGYGKVLSTIYTIFFIIYVIIIIDSDTLRKALKILLGILCFLSIIIFFQRVELGFITYPGTLRYVLKIILSLVTIVYYRYNNIDFLNIYIKTLAFLAAISIPFWLINYFGFYGMELEGGFRKSFFFYTSLETSLERVIPRNSGMFWEPGAFAGYLILAIVFIALKNRKFDIGPYKKEVLWILIGLITSMSTTGFITLGIVIIVYSFQNYGFGKIIIIPMVIFLFNIAYLKLTFLNEKIEYQFSKAIKMNKDDTSASRFGAFIMDLQYIKSKPLIGNGLHIKTRYRLHPWIKENINQGNGISNAIATWGIPFFLLWLFCLFRFAKKISHSFLTALGVSLVINLVLLGEQFLNYPLFLTFFFLPFLYQNILSTENKIFILKNYIK